MFHYSDKFQIAHAIRRFDESPYAVFFRGFELFHLSAAALQSVHDFAHAPNILFAPVDRLIGAIR
ncbi:MAG: hypothetical protein A3E78_03645 [Alphaproteobacteria bacterium RIFCSPHIGHO2_12_FULL_63_12]|nr:MAG: hypothetical protein A3E78_03645 [Alphaproteobacteria bacterium RIFCSPHIGHO2_12_FULL_63_12]